ncbi:PIG-L family deacetylase [bacterium]|nr:PIG-L family deacetylase [bacterium]
MKIFGIGMHPDDVEFIMAGTLALLKKKGHKITIATVGSGDMGSVEYVPADLSRKRYMEAKSSAKLLEAEYISCGISCLHVVFDNPTRFMVTEMIRKVDPDIVITMSPQDYMKDHEITADLVWDGCFNAPIPNYHTALVNPAKATSKIPYLYYGDSLDLKDRFGNPVHPEFYVDIKDVMETKTSMLRKHESQRSWLKRQHGMDKYTETMKEISSRRGKEIGIEYAEGFRQHKGHPFPQDNILEKLLKDKVKYKKQDNGG